MRNNKSLPLKSLTLLSSAAKNVGWRVDGLIYELKELGNFHKTLRTLYEAIEIANQVKDGDVSYPGSTSTDLGMKIEFRRVPPSSVSLYHVLRSNEFSRSVSFTYPQKGTPALQDLSFTIEPGQLCVIVGENGCGKVCQSRPTVGYCLTFPVHRTYFCHHPEQHSESPRKIV